MAEELKSGIEWLREFSRERRLARQRAAERPTLYYFPERPVPRSAPVDVFVNALSPEALRYQAERKARRETKVARLLKAQDGCCYLCTGEFGPDRKPTIEHVRPRAHGVGSARNVLLACAPCNNRKADRMPTIQELAYLKRINAAMDREDEIARPLERAA